MNIEKKLDVWTKEKLITGAQKKAVLEYEERLKSRSLLYTLLFLGGFCFSRQRAAPPYPLRSAAVGFCPKRFFLCMPCWFWPASA